MQSILLRLYTLPRIIKKAALPNPEMALLKTIFIFVVGKESGKANQEKY
jgi:hypothetical protein